MTGNIPENQKTIVLTGFMGVGKTTVGELVAQKLSRPFIDVDAEIESDFGMPISAIFARHGEPAFREYEQKKTCGLAQEKQSVLSVGGGAFLNPVIQQTCMDHCVVIFLEMTWEDWKERLHLLTDSRPVLQSKSMEEIKELFQKRQQAYAVHHSNVLIRQQTPEEIADCIIKSLQH